MSSLVEVFFADDSEKRGRNFGRPCAVGSKALCCRSKTGDDVWEGLWEEAHDNEKYHCQVLKENSQCGMRLKCSSVDKELNFRIKGRRCRDLEGHDCSGNAAKAGYIEFRGARCSLTNKATSLAK